MSKATEHPTHFDNLSDGALVDELGRLKADMAELAAREAALKTALVDRCIVAAEGALFRAVILPETIRWVLDGEAGRAAMGEAWVLRHSKRSLVKPTVRVTARGASRRAAA